MQDALLFYMYGILASFFLSTAIIFSVNYCCWCWFPLLCCSRDTYFLLNFGFLHSVRFFSELHFLYLFLFFLIFPCHCWSLALPLSVKTLCPVMNGAPAPWNIVYWIEWFESCSSFQIIGHLVPFFCVIFFYTLINFLAVISTQVFEHSLLHAFSYQEITMLLH